MQFLESQFQLRNKEDHEKQCNMLKNDDSGKCSKEFGIYRNACLNELKYFNVCDGSLIPDIMHDMLDGVLQYEVKLMIQYMITIEHYFTLDMVNTKLENLDLGTSESKNRPTSIPHTTFTSDGNSLKQNGKSQFILL